MQSVVRTIAGVLMDLLSGADICCTEACLRLTSRLLRVRHQSDQMGRCLADATDSYADVVKTRLQVEAKTGQTHYKGMADAFAKICA